ncbi:MAG: hypothetical protein AB7O52_07740 [Planctomycetota bacterium]
MRQCGLLAVAFFIVSCNPGCSVSSAGSKVPAVLLEVLEHGEDFTLFSLDPAVDTNATNPFHDWRIIGSTPIPEAATRSRVVSSLIRGIDENDGTVAACFNPRHGLRVTHAGVVHDLVICFECMQVRWYSGSTSSELIRITPSPQRTFDATLTGAGVELAPAAAGH